MEAILELVFDHNVTQLRGIWRCLVDVLLVMKSLKLELLSSHT